MDDGKEAPEGGPELNTIQYNTSPVKNISLLDRTIIELAKKVKKEDRNNRAVLNVGILGLVGYPSNLLFDASPSEGKTHIIVNNLKVFPTSNVLIYRDASPKSFVHESGELGVKIINEETGDVEYQTTIFDETQDEEISIGEYLHNLQIRKEQLEKESKKDSNKRRELSNVNRELRGLKEHLVTIINFDGTIVAFLDQPQPELLKNLLSVMSHDSYYIETTFTEGEGSKFTKHVVFRGFPTFIFAVSKDSFLNWKDIETRFEVREPNMSAEKYQAAVELSLKEMFGEGEKESEEMKNLKDEIRNLITKIKDDMKSRKLTFLIPLEEKTIVGVMFGGEIKHGDAMRKIPRIMNHIRASAIWNYDRRVHLIGPGNEYIVVAAEDIRSLVQIYDDLEINSILSGIPASLYEFWRDILTPLFMKDLEGEYVSVKQSDIVKKLDNYCDDNKGKTRLRPGKLTVSRNLTKLEERGLIKKVEDDKDKRGRKIITLIDPEDFVVSLNTKIEELINEISITMENGDDTILHKLLSKGYSAFLEHKKIVSQNIGILQKNEKEISNEVSDKAIIREIVHKIAQVSGYALNTPLSDDTNFDTKNNVAIANKKFEVLSGSPSVVFYYSGPGETIDVTDSTQGISGNQSIKLKKEDILSIPESIAKSLEEAGLGKILDGGGQNEHS